MRQGFAKDKPHDDEILPVEETSKTIPDQPKSVSDRLKRGWRNLMKKTAPRPAVEELAPRETTAPTTSPKSAPAGHMRPKVTEEPIPEKPKRPKVTEEPIPEKPKRPKVTEEPIPEKPKTPPAPTLSEKVVAFGKKAAPVLKDVAKATGSAIKMGAEGVGKGVQAHAKWVNDSNYEYEKRQIELAERRAGLRSARQEPEYEVSNDEPEQPSSTRRDSPPRYNITADEDPIPPGPARKLGGVNQQQGSSTPSRRPVIEEEPLQDDYIDEEPEPEPVRPPRQQTSARSVYDAGMKGFGQGLQGEFEPFEPEPEPEPVRSPRRQARPITQGDYLDILGLTPTRGSRAPSGRQTQASIDDILGLTPSRGSRAPSGRQTQAEINNILGINDQSFTPSRVRGDLMNSTDLMASIFGTGSSRAPRASGTKRGNMMNDPSLALSIMGAAPSAPIRQSPPPQKPVSGESSKVGQKKANRAKKQARAKKRR